MYKLLIPLALVALSACVPVAPVGGPVYYGGQTVVPVEPDIYDLPAHCYYDAYRQVICR
ncbi:hypothetical protein [Jannaschia sp. CCS1]|uniref:hypothetical protein n=1 Tax=Jannaschia sp. (strain CCS1) TaxID=290400 RepID=UPI000053C3F1|nr:hypothetical protein [Jannaschia sp. CCS1]